MILVTDDEAIKLAKNRLKQLKEGATVGVAWDDVKRARRNNRD